MDQYAIYILECEGGRWYVGKSKNVQSRIKQHFNGQGAAWTKKYKPLKHKKPRIIHNCRAFDEDVYTKEYMQKHGIDNVRGGSYCEINLKAKIRKVLEKELRTVQNECYHCHQPGHMVTNCPKRQKSTRSTSFTTSKFADKSCSRCGW